MSLINSIEERICAQLQNAQVHIEEHQGQYLINVVSSEFEGESTVIRQKKVYAPLAEFIGSGAIHAVTIKTYTPKQWKNLES